MKYIIIGAGPAGLTVARCLLNKGITSFVVLEREAESGGLCRSEYVDGAALDIGGGHFLDARNQQTLKFLFEFMPSSEWNFFERDSRIFLHGKYVSHPLEANIWQFPYEVQKSYLESIAAAGCNNGREKPEKFTDWIIWKLGERIAEDYMLPYNRKMFADQLDELGTYWLEKLPNVSYEETLQSCKDKRAYGKQPGHATFYYPKEHGYGEVWRRIADSMAAHIEYNRIVMSIDVSRKEVLTSNGKYKAEHIINTAPWKSFTLDKVSADMLNVDLKELLSSSIEVRYFPQDTETKAHWVYYPQDEMPYHRILCRHNFLPGSRGCWTETRVERTYLFREPAAYSYINEYAYPLNTIRKPQAISRILKYMSDRGIYGVGRWGKHEHLNSDIVVSQVLEMFS